MEQLTFFTKVRFVAALGIAALLFGFIALPLARPEMPGGTLLLVQHVQPIPVVMVVVLLALLTPGVALLSAADLRYITALAATPVGLAVLALWTAGIGPKLAEISIEERGGLYHAMLIDLLLWCGVVWIGVLAARLIVKGPIRELITHSSDKKAETTSVRKKTAQTWVINTLVGITGVVVLAYLLLRLLIHSGQVQINVAGVEMSPPPDKGQIIFGLIAAFGLATLGVHQLFELHVEGLLLAVVVVGVIVIFPGISVDSTATALLAPTCLTSSQLLRAITPLTWAAFGSIGILWGYWLSLRLHYARMHMGETTAK